MNDLALPSPPTTSDRQVASRRSRSRRMPWRSSSAADWRMFRKTIERGKVDMRQMARMAGPPSASGAAPDPNEPAAWRATKRGSACRTRRGERKARARARRRAARCIGDDRVGAWPSNPRGATASGDRPQGMRRVRRRSQRSDGAATAASSTRRSNWMRARQRSVADGLRLARVRGAFGGCGSRAELAAAEVRRQTGACMADLVKQRVRRRRDGARHRHLRL